MERIQGQQDAKSAISFLDVKTKATTDMKYRIPGMRGYRE